MAKDYPLEKYKFYQNGNKVIAVSRFAGQTVRGVAACDPRDTFDIEIGKRLAAGRCNAKVAQKRLARASRKLAEAETQLANAYKHRVEMFEYFYDSNRAMEVAYDELRENSQLTK